ncbi:hypothetical protein PoB_003573400 [Plakobranchus ocellatus]|uniref:Uncharacterized protein n=1 Tax=Plakobranchus ocellatus TaxID=259542 RepID=A0AAV4AN52_9GAST|nr:hypothetical protein PoB_003573400 [Plakobranchus ocellatus]
MWSQVLSTRRALIHVEKVMDAGIGPAPEQQKVERNTTPHRHNDTQAFSTGIQQHQHAQLPLPPQHGGPPSLETTSAFR